MAKLYLLNILRASTLILVILINSAWAQMRAQENEQYPLLEFGAGAVYFEVPDYPGSSESTQRLIPFPAGIYRGKVLRADDEDGVHGRLRYTDRFQLNFSFDLTFSSNAKEHQARNGMSDLDTLFEIGPSLIYTIIRPDDSWEGKLRIHFPIRYAFSSDFKYTKHRGAVFNPFLSYIHRNFLIRKLNLFISSGARFATNQYMDFYYGVDQQFVTPSRPAYEAHGGHLDVLGSFGFSYTVGKNTTLFTGIGHSNFHWAENKESPLLAKRNNTSWAFGFVWWFYESGLVEGQSFLNSKISQD